MLVKVVSGFKFATLSLTLFDLFRRLRFDSTVWWNSRNRNKQKIAVNLILFTVVCDEIFSTRLFRLVASLWLNSAVLCVCLSLLWRAFLTWSLSFPPPPPASPIQLSPPVTCFHCYCSVLVYYPKLNPNLLSLATVHHKSLPAILI